MVVRVPAPHSFDDEEENVVSVSARRGIYKKKKNYMKEGGAEYCNHSNVAGVVLKIEKWSDFLTNLVCINCGTVVAVWESDDITERNKISEEELKKLV